MKRLFLFYHQINRDRHQYKVTADIADTHPNDTDTDLETTTNNNNGTGNNLATDSSSSLINSHLRTSSNDLNTLAKQLNNPVFLRNYLVGPPNIKLNLSTTTMVTQMLLGRIITRVAI